MELKRIQVCLVIMVLALVVLLYAMNQDHKENFENQDTSDKYQLYQGSYFNITKSTKGWDGITLEESMEKCNKDKNCLGFTRSVYDSDNGKGKTYVITESDLARCKSIYQGSDLERSKAKSYKTYLKTTLKDHENYCLTDEGINRDISLYNSQGYYLTVDDQTLYGTKKSNIQINQLYYNCKFRIVPGLYGNRTVSFEIINDDSKSMYITHNYPKRHGLIAKKPKSEDDNKNASFKLVRGLDNGNGLSIKILGFPDVYLKYENVNTNKKLVTLETSPIEKSVAYYKLATFQFRDPLSEKTLNDYVEQEEIVEPATPQEKIKKLKMKNINVLEEQNVMLEKQRKMMDDFQFSHSQNLNEVGRGFANQMAYLALGKHLEEKNQMDMIEKKLKDNQPGSDIPSKESINDTS